MIPALRNSLPVFAALVLLLSAAPSQAALETDPATDILTEPGSAGLGLVTRVQPSPYDGVSTKVDLLPLYLFESERVYLRSTRLGLRLLTGPVHQLDAVLDRRLEGLPNTDLPAGLTGLAERSDGTDAGLAWRYRQHWGTVQFEALRDVSRGHRGNELRLGYRRVWQSGGLRVQPSATLARRSSALNDYYYGVRPNEAAPGRPAYRAGTGINTTLALDSSYAFSGGWRLMGGVSATLLAGAIADSPIVGRRVLPAVYVGAAYDFGAPRLAALADNGAPLHLKALYGTSTEDGCHLVRIVTARCFSTGSNDRTHVAGVQIGKSSAQNWNGWPVDLVGYAGLTRHDERGLQANGLQADLFVKGYFHGFPWSQQVATRAGLGIGLSLAQRAPYIEASSQAAKGERGSRLLNYLDPSIDVSIGDLTGLRSLKQTYVGFGVSHRSGVFGASRLLGNVKGGSNYIYSYLETVF
jgi:MipA family protein